MYYKSEVSFNNTLFFSKILPVLFRMKSDRIRQSKIQTFLTCALGGHIILFGVTGWSIDLQGPFLMGIVLCLFRSIFEVRQL